MSRGSMYLAAGVDWHSRKILSWRMSNTMDADFCVEALKEGIGRYGCQEIFDADQGAQFTSDAFASVLKDHGIDISMDGRGRVRDNIFIERLWWTLRHHYLYLRSFANGSELRAGLRDWVPLYKAERSQQALDNRSPDEVYSGVRHPFAEAG